MKTTNYSGEQGRSRDYSYQRSSPFRAETAVFAALGVVGFVAVVIAVVSGSIPARLRDDRLADRVRFRSEQLAADMRTAIGIVCYVLAADPPPWTNGVERGSTQKNLASPANAAAVEPNV